jgi:radical SAM protein with 4Fe4S-binding SPASM domain
MKAINLSNKNPGGKREKLINKLPLSTPYVVQIFPIYKCCAKCNYCLFSVQKKDRGFVTDKDVMDYNLFKKCVDDFSRFENQIKVCRIVGLGEPLLHPKISEMCDYLKQSKKVKVVEIITNGILLNNKLSDKLIDKVDRLIISLQGITEKSYKEISNVKIDLNKFIDNIKYFYEHKKLTHIYIKIADISLKNKEDKNKFFDLFGDICDSIAIEEIVPLHEEINYSYNILKKTKTQFGEDIKESIKICSQPFIHFQINPDGKITPCYSWSYPEILGDANNESLYDIWNGKKFNEFRLHMLKETLNFNKICKDCQMIQFRQHSEDIIDNKVKIKKLIKYYTNN